MQITSHFDPLLAKVIVYGSTRKEAIFRFLKSLQECQVYGAPNNVEYLAAVVSSPEFFSGQTTTTFLDDFHYIPWYITITLVC